MKMRFVACMLVLALLLCGVAAYAKVTTTPNGYTIDFTYDKYRASSSSMYGVYCEAEASLSPAKAGWYKSSSCRPTRQLSCGHWEMQYDRSIQLQNCKYSG